ncbi:O-antigen ligase family protein [Salinicoccus roseus]|uniref:O-antigen ligase family protein n=1 Tax=Salinicoccus roseus TaxID=45670 RepID=UPI002300C7EC|nr:O-antigen ligase family protein [Salinicoccus roseus]
MNKSHLKIILFFALAYLTTNFIGLTNILYIFPLIILFSAMKSPILGISLWIITLPLGTFADDSIYHLNLGFLNIGLFIKLFFIKRARVKGALIFFAFSFILTMFLSILINDSFIISNYFLTINSFGMFFLTTIFLINYKDKNIIDYIVLSFTIAAITMVVFIFRDFNSMIMYDRLAFGGNVRKLANALGLPILLLSAYIINNNKANIKILNKRIASILLIIFTTLLVLSASRGVIFSVSIAIIIYFLLSLNSKRLLKNTFLYALPGTVILLMVFQNIDFGFQFQLDRILELTSNNRSLIWSSTIKEFFNSNLFIILFGSGFGNFRLIAMDAYGVNTYAHSVFFDTLVSLGIVGFVILISFFILMVTKCIKTGNKLAFMILIYTILSFATHGQVHNVLFWLNVAIIYSLTNMNNLQGHSKLIRIDNNNEVRK